MFYVLIHLCTEFAEKSTTQNLSKLQILFDQFTTGKVIEATKMQRVTTSERQKEDDKRSGDNR